VQRRVHLRGEREERRGIRTSAAACTSTRRERREKGD
jgi:hypothetical protein